MVYVIKDYVCIFRIWSRLSVTTRQLTGCGAQANNLKILLLLLRFSDAEKVWYVFD